MNAPPSKVPACIVLLLVSTPCFAGDPPEKSKGGEASGQEQGQPEDNIKKAKGLIEAGDTRYRSAEFHKALEHYQQALKHYNHPAIIFNIAQCHRQIENSEKALFFYRLFLSEMGRRFPNKPLPYHAEVQRHIKKLSAVIAKKKRLDAQALRLKRLGVGLVDLEGVPVGARVLVDGVFRQRGPLKHPMEVRPGLRVLEVSLEDHQSWRGTVEVGGGKTVSIKAVLRPDAGSSRIWLISGITTAALAAGSFGVGLGYNLKTNNTVKYTDQWDQNHDLSVMGYVMAGGFVAASSVCWILYARARKKERRLRGRAVTVLPVGNGILVSGSF